MREEWIVCQNQDIRDQVIQVLNEKSILYSLTVDQGKEVICPVSLLSDVTRNRVQELGGVVQLMEV
jgi:hypothetical protein